MIWIFECDIGLISYWHLKSLILKRILILIFLICSIYSMDMYLKAYRMWWTCPFVMFLWCLSYLFSLNWYRETRYNYTIISLSKKKGLVSDLVKLCTWLFRFLMIGKFFFKTNTEKKTWRLYKYKVGLQMMNFFLHQGQNWHQITDSVFQKPYSSL